jgi:hypothetical protein
MPKHVQPVPYQAKFINNLAQIFCSSSPLLGHSSRTEGGQLAFSIGSSAAWNRCAGGGSDLRVLSVLFPCSD